MKIGEFEYRDGAVYGPKVYMLEQGKTKLDSIMSGQAAGFNAMLAARPDISPVQMVLVALQTDYAGWIGMRQFHQSFHR